MNCAIVSEEEIASDKGAATLETLERTLFGVCGCLSVGWKKHDAPGLRLTGPFMSTSMLASAEGAVAELAFVLLLRRSGGRLATEGG